MDRGYYAKLVEELPFQPIADTPTVKHYTDWRVYEERFSLENSTVEDRLPGVLEGLKYSVALGVDARVLEEPRGAKLSVFRGGWDGDPKPMSLVGVHSRMHAYHAYRWSLGLLVTFDDYTDFGDFTILSLGGDGYTGHHAFIKIGKGSRGRIYIVDYAGPTRGLKTFIVEGLVGEDAEVELNILSLHSREHAVYTLAHIVSGDGSSVKSRVLSLGGAMSRLQVDYIVEGEKAKLSALASAVSRSDAKADVILNSVNKGPESDVTVSARGAVFNRGYLALRGSAIVGKEARWASSEIELQVILMGDEARGHAVPVLEIHSGDVAKANHAAGISHILEEQKFYLKARGLSDEEVSALLIGGIIEYSGLVGELQLDPLELLKI